MKNTLLLIDRADIHDHVMGLWRTDDFRKSHQDGGFVYSIVDRYARLPRFFTEMSNDHDERAHFSVWWGGITKRSYERSACNDLYYLHEITHGAEMIHTAGQDFENFKRRMIDNELYASVISEMAAYFAMPGLRAQAFPGEIYADRLLADPVMHAKWNEDRMTTLMDMFYRRRQAMFWPKEGDRYEQWMHGFVQQNEDWFTIWRQNAEKVEVAMEQLNLLSLRGRRAEAIQRHHDWLLSDPVTGGTGDIPFPTEAAAFAKIYWRNREHNPMNTAKKNAA